MTDRQGQQLDNYRLIRLLGQGAFGEVYLAEHIRRKTQVAVKVLLTQLSSDELHAFLNEARVFRLKHPNIVQVLDFGVEGRTPFIVMAYAPNGTLRQHHPKGTRVPLPTIVSYVKQVASALQYAHDERLIHRDVKPENMLIGAENQILLSDFGMATIDRSTLSQSEEKMAGTIAYMAPEQIQAHPRPASDQYALGVVVYEWLCGERPFQGAFTEVAMKHTMVPPQRLREKMPTIAPDVEQIVMKALAKDPNQRFGSVLAFANALESASYGIESASYGIESVSYGIPIRPSQHRISRRAVVTGVSLGVGLVIVGGSIAWLVSSHSIVGQTPTPAPSPSPTPTPIPLGMLLYTYRGHSALVNAVAWSSDGKRIASGSYDRTVQVWNAANGGHTFTYRGHFGPANAVAWSPDGKRIASASSDKTVQVWDAVDGSHVFTYRGHSDVVLAVAWSPDGKRIASGGVDKTVQVWDAADGGHAFTYRGHSDVVDTVAWSSDGKRIASASYDQTVQVWDAADGGHAFTYPGHSSRVNAVAWSSDGKRIASGSDDKTVQVWDAADGGHVFTYKGHSNLVEAVVWSPDGKHIASASFDKTVQVWDAADGGHVFTYREHSDVVDTVAWSPDGKRIASGSYDRTVQVWEAG